MSLKGRRVLIGSTQLVGGFHRHKRESFEQDRLKAIIVEAMAAGADGWNVFAIPLLLPLIRWFRERFPEVLLVLTVGANQIEEELALAGEIIPPLALLVHSRVVDCPSLDLLKILVQGLRSKSADVILSTQSPARLVGRIHGLREIAAVAAPVNCVGYGFNLVEAPIADHLQALDTLRSHLPILGFSVLAGGAISLNEGLGYAACFSDSFILGVSTVKQAKETVRLAHDRLSQVDGSLAMPSMVNAAAAYVDKTIYTRGSRGNAVLARSEPACWGVAVVGKDHTHPREVETTVQPSVSELHALVLEVTGACNYSCVHCYAEWGNTWLEEDTASACIRDFAKCGGKLVKFSGGEPMMYPALYPLVQLASDIGLGVTICTNGSLLSKSSLRFLVHHGASLQISVDSLERDSAEAIRGPGTHSKTIQALELLRDCVPDQWTAMTTITKLNIHTIEPMLSQIKEYRPRQVAFSLFKPLGSAQSKSRELTPAAGDVMTLGRKLLIARHVPMRVVGTPGSLVMRDLLYKVGKPRCVLGKQIRVDPFGKIFPCPQFGDESWSIGTLADGLVASLSGVRMAKLRRHVFDRPSRIVSCSFCFWKGFCLGGCPARTGAAPGEDLVPDDLCGVRQYLFPFALESVREFDRTKFKWKTQ